MTDIEFWLLMIAIFILILISAFFSSSETALTAVSDARMHQISKKGDKRASLVKDLRAKRDLLISAILIGNNAVNVLASVLATSIAITILGEGGVAFAAVIMTLILVVFAEVFPKSYAFKNADKVILFPIYTAGEKIKLGFEYVNFAKQLIKNSKVRLFLIKDKYQLASFIKKNFFGKKIVISMGAGSISGWIREIPILIK